MHITKPNMVILIVFTRTISSLKRTIRIVWFY